MPCVWAGDNWDISWGCEDCYGKALFAREGFTRLADQLRTIQGRILLLINDMPAIRKICVRILAKTNR